MLGPYEGMGLVLGLYEGLGLVLGLYEALVLGLYEGLGRCICSEQSSTVQSPVFMYRRVVP